MIDVTDKILMKLAEDLVEIHSVGGIELEHWESATEFVKRFYHIEERVQLIVLGGK